MKTRVRDLALKFSLALFLLFGIPQVGLSFCDAILQSVNQTKYAPYCCETNVWHLLTEMKNNNEDLSQVSVLILSIPDSTVLAPNARNGWKEWRYHVVLLKDGKIQDFDYGNGQTPQDSKDYFHTMFKRRIGTSNHMSVLEA